MSHLDGIRAQFVDTAGLRQHVLESGDPSGAPLVLLHGNFSSSTYFETLMSSLPDHIRAIAPDLRGYGETETARIDARRGARDWADDLRDLLDALGLDSAHLLGWSIGAAPIMQFAVDLPGRVRSLTLVAPVSPYGFGGTRGVTGEPVHEDFAGSGGGVVAESFVARIRAGDRSRDDAQSPLNVIYGSFFHELEHLDRERQLLDGSLQQRIGDDAYPGDSEASSNWPFVAPGQFGPLNAVSPRHYQMARFAEINPQPPVLWVRGDNDVIVANESTSDMAVLGQARLVEGWPGAEVYPAQPMVDQMRDVLDAYQHNGGYYREVVFENVGHSPFIEAPERFIAVLLPHLN